MADKHICVAIYTTHAQADGAYSRLETEGYSMQLLSVAGRDYWSEMAGSRHTKGRFTYRGKHGSFWDRLWANLPGWGIFFSYPDGPLLVSGSLVRTMVAELESGNSDGDGDGHRHGDGDGDGDGHRDRRRTGFEQGLSGIGIPRDSIVEYEKALMDDHILLFVFGSIEEVEQAQTLLNETKAINHTLHHGIKNVK